jgi:hypothetical protein
MNNLIETLKAQRKRGRPQRLVFSVFGARASLSPRDNRVYYHVEHSGPHMTTQPTEISRADHRQAKPR